MLIVLILIYFLLVETTTEMEEDNFRTEFRTPNG